MQPIRRIAGLTALALSLSLAGCGGGGGSAETRSGVKNLIFFLGDGMGTATLTAARIYAVGEDGQLTLDTLPETAWVRTYSNDAQVTDSAPSMSAYMTGVKMNNDVISMSADTVAVPPDATNTVNNCAKNGANGAPAKTLFELAKSAGMAVGAVTTTRITHATPAATYAHICHRDLENDIAAQLSSATTAYNYALKDGVDVLFGGGRKHFLPNSVSGGYRTDGRDLTAEMKSQGYAYVTDAAGLNAIDASASRKALGLFTSSHMSYELDRDSSKEPSLAQMTAKAIDLLGKNPQGYVLMVEGGRIDHALHETNAIRALQDTVAFDQAIRTALDKVDLSNTLIVVTADHDHTLVLNGYAKRTGATTASNPGVLGLVKNVVSGQPEKDADGVPYTILGFGNGENRVAGARSTVAALDEATTGAKGYHQEAAVRMNAGSETHGGTDVVAHAAGRGAEGVHGFMTNTELFGVMRAALGL
jgi:alkaline phosphatase